MAETLALAIGVPAVLGAAWLVSRRGWSPTLGDIRGIALQTVIVIVVMLVIAGGVAGVLLSRADQVQGDLAAVNTGIDPTDSFELCDSTGENLTGGGALTPGNTLLTLASNVAAVAFVPTSSCSVSGPAGAFSSQDCTSRDGAFTSDADSVLCVFTA